MTNLNNVLGMSIRVITDNADEEMEKDLNRNWGNSLESLFSALNIIFEKELINQLLD